MKTTSAIIIAGLLIAGAIFLVGGSSSSSDSSANANNVSVTNGKQIVDISVKGGYHPKQSIAKAGIPTVLRFNTNGTFDCSSSIRIPSMGYSKILPSSGETDVDLGTPATGTVQGTCGMGMYSFAVQFN